jgi:hypothetical protein
MGQGRATRKNKKDYGRPSVDEKKRVPSQNELNRYLTTMRKENWPSG